MSTDTHVPPLDDAEVLIEAYEAQRSFKFNGAVFRPGDKISMRVYLHPRFEALIHTGYIRAVK